MIVVDPSALPVTTPVPDPTDAVEGKALVQVPPPVRSVNVIVLKRHTVGDPEIAAGAAFTVTTVVVVHPPAAV